MRIAKVMGTLILNQSDENLPNGKLLICEVLDNQALGGLNKKLPRKEPMPESLVAFDELGAGEGCLIALAESGEAAAPFKPKNVPLDAYCAAILDEVVFEA
ncbi:MAG: EutN/CcmL family microcompartment protein [Deltaproteobacteria bacterium]|jgi:microcompartment protein CcmK/EutM|nr:EutN/CcmL family microcompartment protein [Deltaproteobacteria bacterium]MBT4527155.1 EutN/CcmL family microcompartment protein [Deltaproteobacteria bacterium]